MKVLKPFYYDDFNCIGGLCKDTCCANWNITIDAETYKMYQQIDGDFGKKLNQSIETVDNKVKQFILDKDSHCPFLNKDLLCDVYINIGEDKMCKTCRTYPRTGASYGDVIIQDLTLSCPEIAKIMISNKNSIEFYYGEYDDENDINIEIENNELFNALITGCCISVDILQLKEISLWKRTFLCLQISNKIQSLMDSKEYDSIKNELDKYQKDDYLEYYFNGLEVFPDNIKLRLKQYEFLLGVLSNIKIHNKKFEEYYKETLNFFKNNNAAELISFFNEKVKSFESYFQEKEYIYENFLVYQLYHYYLSAYKKGNVYKSVVMMIEGYSIIKLFGIIRWYNNGYQLSDEEQCEILYSYSRTLEHLVNGYDTVFNIIHENGYDKMAYLVELIR